MGKINSVSYNRDWTKKRTAWNFPAKPSVSQSHCAIIIGLCNRAISILFVSLQANCFRLVEDIDHIYRLAKKNLPIKIRGGWQRARSGSWWWCTATIKAWCCRRESRTCRLTDALDLLYLCVCDQPLSNEPSFNLFFGSRKSNLSWEWFFSLVRFLLLAFKTTLMIIVRGVGVVG